MRVLSAAAVVLALCAGALADNGPVDRGQRWCERTVTRQSTWCRHVLTCKEIRTCAEAMFRLQTCNHGDLDGDGDGIPCENWPCNRDRSTTLGIIKNERARGLFVDPTESIACRVKS